MTTIASAMQQDETKESLEGYNEGGMTFTFKEEQGIKLFFETSAENPEIAARKAEGLIKAQPWGIVLYFRSTAVQKMV